MLSLRNPPDFAALALAADRLSALVQARGPSSVVINGERREVQRKKVSAPLYTGIVPRGCDKMPLARIPVSVFKPLDAGWAVDVSTFGVAWLSTAPIDLDTRSWVGLHEIAARPTILPVKVRVCQPVDDGLFRIGAAYTMRPADLAERLGITVQYNQLELRVA